MTRKHQQDRQVWLGTFESNVTFHLPRLSGRIDWDTAIHFFNMGMDAHKAAHIVIAREHEREARMVANFVSEGLGE